MASPPEVHWMSLKLLSGMWLHLLAAGLHVDRMERILLIGSYWEPSDEVETVTVRAGCIFRERDSDLNTAVTHITLIIPVETNNIITYVYYISFIYNVSINPSKEINAQMWMVRRGRHHQHLNQRCYNWTESINN